MTSPSDKPREFSHPALWTAGLLVAAACMGWAFFHWLAVGMQHGRDQGPINFAAAEAAKPVDHAALIADRSPAVIERGQQLYLRNCAACHGANGDKNMTGSSPAPRNLHTEPYKAEWGGGPYGFYLTLSKGYGQGMPGFSNLDDADRYAIAHFVRETWQKGTPLYHEQDAPAVAAQIPKPGAAADSGPRTPPELVEQNPRLHPLMALVVQDDAGQAQAVQSWIADAVAQAEPAERNLIERVRAAGSTRAGWLQNLHAAASSGDRAAVIAVLLDSQSGDPSLALAPAASVEVVVTVLVGAAGRKT